MYILIVGRGYPTSKNPLNGIFEMDQARALAQIGHKVVYAPVDLRSIRRWRKWGIIESSCDNVHVLGISIPVGAVPYKCFDEIGKFAFKILYSHIKKIYGVPDLIHAHFLDSAAISAETAKQERIPFIITEHSSKLNEKNIQYKEFLRAENTYKSAKQIIAVSNRLCDNIKANFAYNPVCIYNIVNIDIFKYNDRTIDRKEFKYVSTGNLKKIKGFDILLHAFQKVIKVNKNCRLCIIGDGPEKINLIKLADDLKINEYVIFKGILNRGEIAEIYANSDAFILTSRSETFGVAYIEAMSTGLPVIATKCGGPEDYINENLGYIVDVDENQVFEAMRNMINNKNNFDRKFISDYVHKKFSPDIIAAQLTDLYEKTLEEV